MPEPTISAAARQRARRTIAELLTRGERATSAASAPPRKRPCKKSAAGSSPKRAGRH